MLDGFISSVSQLCCLGTPGAATPPASGLFRLSDPIRRPFWPEAFGRGPPNRCHGRRDRRSVDLQQSRRTGAILPIHHDLIPSGHRWRSKEMLPWVMSTFTGCSSHAILDGVHVGACVPAERLQAESRWHSFVRSHQANIDELIGQRKDPIVEFALNAPSSGGMI